MFSMESVGEKFRGGKFKGKEGIKFDVDDSGCNLIITFKSPSNQEIKCIRWDKLKIGYYTEEEAILLLFKFGNMKWMDAPYSVHLSKQLNQIQGIADGIGLPLTVYFVDGNTGILKVMRLLGLPTNFSRELASSIKTQKSMAFDNYRERINLIFSKYTTKELVKLADLVCNV